MSPLRWLARKIWAAMLWWMRRPFIRHLQRTSLAWVVRRKGDSARANYLRQERWARRHGLNLIHASLRILAISMGCTAIYFGFLEAIERGYFQLPVRGMPEELR